MEGYDGLWRGYSGTTDDDAASLIMVLNRNKWPKYEQRKTTDATKSYRIVIS